MCPDEGSEEEGKEGREEQLARIQKRLQEAFRETGVTPVDVEAEVRKLREELEGLRERRKGRKEE